MTRLTVEAAATRAKTDIAQDRQQTISALQSLLTKTDLSKGETLRIVRIAREDWRKAEHQMAVIELIEELSGTRL